MLPANEICLQCGHHARSWSRFCGACGAALLPAAPETRTTIRLIAPPSAAITPAPNAESPTVVVLPAPQEIAALSPGALLGNKGRYRIERLLGKGGFGQTYLTYDTQLGRNCVVKRPIVDAAWNADSKRSALENFEREARLLVTLNTPGHPNIPEIYEYLAESHCLVMKYIEGQSLRRLLNRRVDPLPEADALRYVRDVCSALVYMHSRTPPILHRDIKPDNILLDGEKRVWVIDFGLSKALPVQSNSQDGQRSQAAGTNGYAPLEQWQGAAEPRSDVYALATTLYTLLTNRQPTTSLAALLQGQVALRPVRQFNLAVQPEVEHLIQHSVEPDVKARPTAQGFLTALEAALNPEVPPPPPPPKRPPDVADFVGREAELSAAAQRLATKHLAVISGMAGIGKTTLVAQLARQVASPDRLFWHPFHPGEGIDVIIWELAAFLAWHGKDDLWRLLHKARRVDGQLPPAELLFDYLIRLVQGQGYVLCFDDFHYVDSDPLLNQLVERLRPELQTGGVGLLVATRRAPAFVSASERELLGGLSAEDTCDLLARRGISLSDQLVADLYGSTGGNAQFLMLSIAALQRAGDAGQLIASLSSTADIEHYLLTQVDAGLTEAERSAMSAAAVLLDYGGTRDAIEAILDSGSFWRTLNELSNRNLLTLSEGVAGREYRQHTIVQAFYYNLLGRRDRQTLHRRAGAYYERDEPDTLKAARHYQCAGEYAHAADLATADVWALINCGQARALRHVLDQFDVQRLDLDRWVAINVARGEVAALLGEHQTSRASYLEALKGLQALPDSPTVRERRARICRGMGESFEPESSQQALDWLQRGLDELVGSVTVEEAFLRFAIGSVLIGAGEHAAAARAIEASLGLLPTDARDWRARALMNLGVIHCSQDDLDRGKDYFLRALDIYQQTRNEWRMAAIRQNLGMLKDIAGDWPAAANEYRQALTMAESLGDVVRQVELTLPLGNLRAKQGDMEAARTYLSRCLTLVRRHTLREQLVYVLASLAHLHIHLAERDAAEAALAEAEHTALDMAGRSHPQFPEIERGWALLRLARGEIDAALGAAEHAVRLARELQAGLDQGIGLRVLGQALLAAGRREEALDAFARSLGLLEGSDPYEAARTKVAWGLALGAVGDEPCGGIFLNEAYTIFRELGAKGEMIVVKERGRSVGDSVIEG